MALFLSTFENKIDRKGRVSVPAPFRTALAGQAFLGVVVYPSFHLPCIEGCDFDRMNEYAARIDQLPQHSPDSEILQHLFADSSQVPFDGEGRIVLPPDLLGYAGIGEAATFVGQGRTFQIWAPERFAAQRSDLRDRAKSNRAAIPPLRAPVPSGSAGGSQ